LIDDSIEEKKKPDILKDNKLKKKKKKEVNSDELSKEGYILKKSSKKFLGIGKW
jgi:hypothetical protein